VKCVTFLFVMCFLLVHGVFNGLQRGERQGFIPGRFRPVAAQDGASLIMKRRSIASIARVTAMSFCSHYSPLFTMGRMVMP